jgi:hypothetical protein
VLKYLLSANRGKVDPKCRCTLGGSVRLQRRHRLFPTFACIFPRGRRRVAPGHSVEGVKPRCVTEQRPPPPVGKQIAALQTGPGRKKKQTTADKPPLPVHDACTRRVCPLCDVTAVNLVRGPIVCVPMAIKRPGCILLHATLFVGGRRSALSDRRELTKWKKK